MSTLFDTDDGLIWRQRESIKIKRLFIFQIIRNHDVRTPLSMTFLLINNPKNTK